MYRDYHSIQEINKKYSFIQENTYVNQHVAITTFFFNLCDPEIKKNDRKLLICSIYNHILLKSVNLERKGTS